jgi:hypothetical protein
MGMALAPGSVRLARPVYVKPHLCALHQLAAYVFVHADGSRYLIVVASEYFVQHKSRPFVWRQLLQQGKKGGPDGVVGGMRSRGIHAGDGRICPGRQGRGGPGRQPAGDGTQAVA